MPHTVPCKCVHYNGRPTAPVPLQEFVEDESGKETPYSLRLLLEVQLVAAALRLRDAKGTEVVSAEMQVRWGGATNGSWPPVQ